MNKMTIVFIESLLPLSLGVVMVALSYFVCLPAERESAFLFLNLLATVAALIVGFASNSIAIMLSSQSKIKALVQESGHLSKLVNHVISCIKCTSFLVIVAILGYFVNHGAIYNGFLFFAFGVTIGSFIRVFYIYSKFARNETLPEQ